MSSLYVRIKIFQTMRPHDESSGRSESGEKIRDASSYFFPSFPHGCRKVRFPVGIVIMLIGKIKVTLSIFGSNLPEFTVGLICYDIERTVGTLAHVADSLSAISQKVFFTDNAIVFDD